MVNRSDPKIIEKARTILEANLARPRSERFADMIARGIIDEHGQVIHKDEAVSNGKKSNGAAAAKKKPSNGKHS